MTSVFHKIGLGVKRFYDRRRKMVSLKPKIASNGRVLLSYLTAPFENPAMLQSFSGHSNHWECHQIGQIFLEMGYEVDVVNWDGNSILGDRGYSICVDIHHNLERIAPDLDPACTKILHITGAHWLYQNEAEYRRCLELQIRRGVTVVPRRQVPPSMGIEFADCATILGNDFTEGTFAYAKKKLFRIPHSCAVTFPPPESKDFDRCRHRFIWLGGSGAVHKGLDRVLEAVAATPELELIVCGAVRDESDFAEAYAQELNHTQNIRALGWTDVAGPQFADLVRNSVGLVYPTCSEGQAGSVITALHAGLVPIVSTQAGVSVEEFGFTLETCEVSEIRERLLHVQGLPVHELSRRAQGAWEYARANHTRDAFSKRYSDAVRQILKDRAR